MVLCIILLLLNFESEIYIAAARAFLCRHKKVGLNLIVSELLEFQLTWSTFKFFDYPYQRAQVNIPHYLVSLVFFFKS